MGSGRVEAPVTTIRRAPFYKATNSVPRKRPLWALSSKTEQCWTLNKFSPLQIFLGSKDFRLKKRWNVLTWWRLETNLTLTKSLHTLEIKYSWLFFLLPVLTWLTRDDFIFVQARSTNPLPDRGLPRSYVQDLTTPGSHGQEPFTLFLHVTFRSCEKNCSWNFESLFCYWSNNDSDGKRNLKTSVYKLYFWSKSLSLWGRNSTVAKVVKKGG